MRRPRERMLWITVFLATIGQGTIIQATAPPRRPGDPAPETAKRIFIPHDNSSRQSLVSTLRRRLEARTGAEPAATPRVRTDLRGTREYPVIAVEFNNRPHDLPIADYQALLFGPAPGPPGPAGPPRATLTQYYKDMSNDALLVTGRVLGWYKLARDDAYYENNVDLDGDGKFRGPAELRNGSGRPFGALLSEGLKQADADVDFGRYDNDGPDNVPNSGDDDGKVDTVFFIHSEAGAETSGGDPENQTNLWSHSWHYSEPDYGHNSRPYVTDDVRKNAQGEPMIGPDGGPSYIVVEDYILQPALAEPKRAGQPARQIQIGVFCHEFAHSLRLPDLYDRTPEGRPDSSGLGHWCLMSKGNYGGDNEHPDRPVAMSAWCKNFLGWAQIRRITENQALEFEPVADRNTTYRLDVPGTDGDEYFLLEYRDKGWSDPAGRRINWDAYLPGSGLAVWHVDERVGRTGNPNWPLADRYDQGQNDSASRPSATSPPTFPGSHALVCLVQADARMDLETPDGRIDAGDLFGDLVDFADDEQLRKGTRGYNARRTGIKLTGINLATKRLVAQVDDLPPVPAELAARHAPAPGGTPPAATGEASSARPSVAPRDPAPLPPTPPGGASYAAVPRVPQAPQAASPPAGRGLTGDQLQAVAPSVNDADREAIRKLKAVDQKLQDGGAGALSPDDRKQLGESTGREIRLSVRPENLPEARQVAAQERTRQIGPETPVEGRVAATVQKIVAGGAKDKTATVRFAPSQQGVERITGLALPSAGRSPAADAEQRIKGDFKDLIGQDVTLSAKAAPPDADANAPARFEQTYAVDGKELPIFEREAAFFYDKQQALTAMTSSVIPPEKLKVGGRPGLVSADEAKQAVCKDLGLCSQTIKSSREGIYLVDGDPAKGRVVLRFEVAAGEQQKDVSIIFDAETRKIIDIK